jgi:hypothetical protein
MVGPKALARSDFNHRRAHRRCGDAAELGAVDRCSCKPRHSAHHAGDGSGSTPARPSCAVVQSPDRRIAKAGFNVREVGTIFITHHHDDHTAGLGTLMSLAWDNQRTKPINVYGPPRTEELVKAAVQYFGISAEIRIADGGRSIPIERLFFGHDVGTGTIYQDANLKVTSIENTHFAFHTGTASTNPIPIASRRLTA